MLTPEYLADVPESMVQLYAQVEADILADMAQRLKAYDYWIPASEHQRRVLLEMGASEQEILKKLSALTGKSMAELKKLMLDAGQQALAADNAIYQKQGLQPPPLRASKPMQQVLNAGYARTAKLFRNLTRTTAHTASGQLEQALDVAYTKVTSGAFDYNTAITHAIKSLAKQGLGAVRYPSGRVDTLETAVRRAVMTGVNQTALQLQMTLADELGSDLVEVTAHAGARPSHAVWQGQIYSRSGKSRSYPDFVQATGYGTGEGLGGWNCRHSFYPYFEGTSRTYSKELLDSYQAQNYEYNGRKMTEYEASQMQRGIERQIRRWKRENAAMQAAGLDSTESAVKLRTWQEKQKDFLRQTGLKRQNEKERIAGWNRSTAARATGVVRSAQYQANRYFSLGSPEKNLQEYLKEKPIIDLLQTHGVEYKQRISEKEIIVSAGSPTIIGETAHAAENREKKADRAKMTIEQAQEYVDSAKLVFYQAENQTLKFLSDGGYAVLNLNHKLVTAVPQKWRRKYNVYLKEEEHENT